MRCRPSFLSDRMLLTRWCNVPSGQIQPQKNRPRNIVDRKSTRLNSSHANIYTLSLYDALPIYALPAQFSFRPDVTNQVVQCPERANPATEKSSQEHRRDDDRQAPEQPAIERVRGQRIGDGDQRVGFQKVVAISGKTKKDQEESEKKGLRQPAQPGKGQPSPNARGHLMATLRRLSTGLPFPASALACRRKSPGVWGTSRSM